MNALPGENVVGPKKKILIVDDDSAVREMLARVLVGEGHTAMTAADGEAALAIAAETPIDLVLLDLNLPGMSGWDTFDRLTRENPLSIVIITARTNQLGIAQGAGAAALLEKPLDFPTLVRTISQLLAEPIESRLVRLAGQPAQFHYRPNQSEKKAKHTS